MDRDKEQAGEDTSPTDADLKPPIDPTATDRIRIKVSKPSRNGPGDSGVRPNPSAPANMPATSPVRVPPPDSPVRPEELAALQPDDAPLVVAVSNGHGTNGATTNGHKAEANAAPVPDKLLPLNLADNDASRSAAMTATDDFFTLIPDGDGSSTLYRDTLPHDMGDASKTAPLDRRRHVAFTRSLTRETLHSAAAAPDVLEPEPAQLQTSPDTLFRRFTTWVLGDPIKTENIQHERVDRLRALAILSSDALSSVAYGTEASLAVLLTAGVVSMGVNIFIGLAIVLLLSVVAFSYRQTISRYPGGGGSYIVAKDNLNEHFGLIAAASLLIDYVLTVSVSVSAGVDALISAFRVLEPYSVLIGLFLIGVIMVVNIRGVRESGNVFMIPTYLFVSSFLLMILVGVVNALLHGGLFTQGHLPFQVNPPSSIPGLHTIPLTPLLILTAFASGCSAMTGTEAISDAVPIFKGKSPPEQARNASSTLVIMASLLGIMYFGTTYIAWRFGFQAQAGSHPTLISLMAGTFFSGYWGWFYYIFQFATTLILVLAANTSFADFPRLSYFLARDEYLPHIFKIQGDRLAFNTGIIVLGILSGALLWIFNGNTDALLNLYALGVFMAFTLSQSSMVKRWLTRKEEGWKHGLPISAFGAFVTFVVTIIIAVTKFDRGAWVVVILIPSLYLMFRTIHGHYQRMNTEVSVLSNGQEQVNRNHLVVVPISGINTIALRGLFYAKSLSPNIIAVHVLTTTSMTQPHELEDAERQLRDHWHELLHSEAWKHQPTPNFEDFAEEGDAEEPEDDRIIGPINGHPKLVVIHAPDRSMVVWILRLIDTLAANHPNDHITVVLPEFVPNHFYEWVLHNQVALRLKWGLLRRTRIVTSNVPYQVAHAPHSAEKVVDAAGIAAHD